MNDIIIYDNFGQILNRSKTLLEIIKRKNKKIFIIIFINEFYEMNVQVAQIVNLCHLMIGYCFSHIQKSRFEITEQVRDNRECV